MKTLSILFLSIFFCVKSFGEFDFIELQNAQNRLLSELDTLDERVKVEHVVSSDMEKKFKIFALCSMILDPKTFYCYRKEAIEALIPLNQEVAEHHYYQIITKGYTYSGYRAVLIEALARLNREKAIKAATEVAEDDRAPSGAKRYAYDFLDK